MHPWMGVRYQGPHRIHDGETGHVSTCTIGKSKNIRTYQFNISCVSLSYLVSVSPTRRHSGRRGVRRDARCIGVRVVTDVRTRRVAGTRGGGKRGGREIRGPAADTPADRLAGSGTLAVERAHRAETDIRPPAVIPGPGADGFRGTGRRRSPGNSAPAVSSPIVGRLRPHRAPPAVPASCAHDAPDAGHRPVPFAGRAGKWPARGGRQVGAGTRPPEPGPP